VSVLAFLPAGPSRPTREGAAPFLLVLVSVNMSSSLALASPEPRQLASLTLLSSLSSLITLCPKRAVILDYLVQRCYTRTARAFAADSTIRHLDADGDELHRPRGEDDSPGITEDALHQADLRQSAYSLPHIAFIASSTRYNPFRCSSQHPFRSDR
jgi:hypothetical protein